MDANKLISFIFELTSAKVGTVTLNGDVTEKVADGVNAFTYTAQLVDGNGTRSVRPVWILSGRRIKAMM
ncbi:hypothetical protein [Morganella morganii]|uniref:hypothetical protein n=1 Tax=Morganella morganii TaxID=582 RepID=UPI0009082521|nr:hypothetical protein [Morganella morganii]